MQSVPILTLHIQQKQVVSKVMLTFNIRLGSDSTTVCDSDLSSICVIHETAHSQNVRFVSFKPMVSLKRLSSSFIACVAKQFMQNSGLQVS